MAASTIPDRELNEGLEMMAKSEAKAIYVVDSFGAFYSEQVRALVKKYLGYCKASGKEVGVHMHNNMQLAFANTIEGIIAGANYLDATMAGLGRGAGNCPMELLLAFLKNPKFELRPVLDCVQNHIEPMRSKLLWGYDLPYLLTGMLNQHPRTAIKFKEAEITGQKGGNPVVEADGVTACGGHLHLVSVAGKVVGQKRKILPDDRLAKRIPNFFRGVYKH
jgi:4-hydroxy 2-oxovalerate aldolase